MDEETLQEQIELAVVSYGETKDPAARQEIEQLSQRLTEFRHLATLENALDRCRFEGMRTPEVRKALDEIGKTITDQWQIEQIWNALHENNEEGRCQLVNAALNPIRFYVSR